MALSTRAPEPPSDLPLTPESASLNSYRVNWVFLGFKGKDWAKGDTVEATPEEAAPYLGGVLSLEP